MKKFRAFIVGIGVIIVFSVSAAFCQDLDGLWFKTTVSGKGYLDDGSNYRVGGKASTKVVNYVQFVYNTV